MKEGKVSWKTSAKTLGANLTFQGPPCYTQLEVKVDEACRMCQRIGWIPLGFQIRSLIMEGLILPRCLFACGATPTPRKPLLRLRSAVVKGLWGEGRTNRCKEIVLTLFVRGHKVDPLQYVDYMSIVGFHRWVLRRHAVRSLCSVTWQARSCKPGVGHGPLKNIMSASKRLGWSWPSPFEFET
eukprot:11452038-Karenia_brevis.AAC.1